VANCTAVSPDTASAAAGITPVVGAAAAAFPAATAEPTSCKPPAVAVIASDIVVTKDMSYLLKSP
jgi:hypothetical protein